MKKVQVCLCILILSSPLLAVTWTDPVLLGELNDPVFGYAAFDPFLSPDGLTIYFNRAGYDGDSRRLWTASRNSLGEPFGNVREINELYTGNRLYSPWVSADGLRLYYAKLVDSYVKYKFYMASREHVNYLWDEKMAFTGIHQDQIYDNYLCLSADELTIYYSRYSQANDAYYIRTATRNSITEQFSNPTDVTELNDGAYSFAPYLLPDGLTIYFAAIRDGKATMDIYRATRDSENDPFGDIESLNLPMEDIYKAYPHVTADESTIYFSTDEGIWVSHAVPEPATLLLLGLGSMWLRRRS